MPEKPRQEFLVALAGPAVNLATAVVLGGALRITGTWDLGAIGALNDAAAILNGSAGRDSPRPQRFSHRVRNPPMPKGPLTWN